ncbi:hypothetical protein GGI12_000196, partial [Dipsacomyces acuminosporus]
MEIRISARREAPSNVDNPASVLERRLTIEYRTLSIQLDSTARPSVQQIEERPRWKSILYRIMPIFKTLDRGKTAGPQHDVKLEQTADEISAFKFHLDTVEETLTKFGTSPVQGLEDSAIKRRRERD